MADRHAAEAPSPPDLPDDAAPLDAFDADSRSLVGARLEREDLAGARLPGLRLTDVLVRDCRVDLAAFTAATLERVTFEDCRLAQSDLQEAACDSVRFHGCDLTEVDLSEARFRRSELRRCTLDLLRGVEHMRGIGMQLDDLLAFAPALADALGVRVLDVDD